MLKYTQPFVPSSLTQQRLLNTRLHKMASLRATDADPLQDLPNQRHPCSQAPSSKQLTCYIYPLATIGACH